MQCVACVLCVWGRTGGRTFFSSVKYISWDLAFVGKKKNFLPCLIILVDVIGVCSEECEW